MTVRVEQGDCIEVIPRLVAEGVQADAICTDPPYHLGEIQHQAGHGMFVSKDKPRTEDRSAARAGFMGKTWDGGDVAFRPETWAAVLSILRPGGFLLAFGGTRTYHRLVCAIEDAGFVIQDCVMYLYGTGFPKNRTLLKPAFEPVILAQKQFINSPPPIAKPDILPICLAYKPGGKRTLQVDECRIPAETSTRRPTGSVSMLGKTGNVMGGSDAGRWPPNVAHDGSDEVMEAFPDAPGMQYGVGARHGDRIHVNTYGDWGPRPDMEPRLDSGSAARFFYSAKADAQDRYGSRHPTVKPVELLKWLVPLVTPIGGTVLDCFAGSGTTGVAALATGRNAILVEREAEYIADIKERLAFYEGSGRHSVAAKNRNRRDTAGTLL